MPPKSNAAEESRHDVNAAAEAPLKPDHRAWDPDPVVVVSRRNRILHYPGALLRGDVSAEQRARWFAMPDEFAAASPALLRNQDPRDLELNYGVTFLGTFTSCWKYRAADDRNIPRSAPPEGDRVLVEPASRHGRPLMTTAAFRDPDTGDRIPALVAAAWARVLAHLRDERGEAHRLFVPGEAYDAPEIAVLPLSEVLRQTTEAGRLAYPTVLDAAERCKDLAHLGALHDYAVRERSAAAITAACRRRAQAVPASRL